MHYIILPSLVISQWRLWSILFMYSFSGNCADSIPISIFTCLWAIYVYIPRNGPHTVFSCSRIGRPILEILNLSQIYECRNWETEYYNSVLEITVSFLGIHNGNQPALHFSVAEVQEWFFLHLVLLCLCNVSNNLTAKCTYHICVANILHMSCLANALPTTVQICGPHRHVFQCSFLPGVTQRCRLYWLTNNALVYAPKCGGREGGCGVSANEYSCTTGAQIILCYLTFATYLQKVHAWT